MSSLLATTCRKDLSWIKFRLNFLCKAASVLFLLSSNKVEFNSCSDKYK